MDIIEDIQGDEYRICTYTDDGLIVKIITASELWPASCDLQAVTDMSKSGDEISIYALRFSFRCHNQCGAAQFKRKTGSIEKTSGKTECFNF